MCISILSTYSIEVSSNINFDKGDPLAIRISSYFIGLRSRTDILDLAVIISLILFIYIVFKYFVSALNAFNCKQTSNSEF